MIIFLYGADSYRSHQKLSQIKQKYIDSSLGDTNLAILEGKDLSANQFKQQVQTQPFLANTRLVIVRNLLSEGKKELQEEVLSFLDRVPNSTVLLLYESTQPDKRLKLFQALQRGKQVQEFAQLSGEQLSQFVQRTAREKGLKISDSLVGELIRLTQGDSWQLVNELEKLTLYEAAIGKSIGQMELKQLVTDNAEFRIFDLTDAFGGRNTKQALHLLGRLQNEENLLGTLALVAGHYRNLLLIADGMKRGVSRQQLATQLKLHSFVFDKASVQAKSYSYEELVECYRYLFYLDAATKQSLLEPLTGLIVLAKCLGTRPLRLPDLTEAISGII